MTLKLTMWEVQYKEMEADKETIKKIEIEADTVQLGSNLFALARTIRNVVLKPEEIMGADPNEPLPDLSLVEVVFIMPISRLIYAKKKTPTNVH